MVLGGDVKGFVSLHWIGVCLTHGVFLAMVFGCITRAGRERDGTRIGKTFGRITLL
jgi:hypothetical protein